MHQPARSIIAIAVVAILAVWLIALMRARRPDAQIGGAAGLQASSAIATPPPRIGATATAPPAEADAQSEQTIDFCGVGTVHLPADDPFAPGRYLAQLTAPVWARWKQAITLSPDYRTRAAALYLASIGATQDEATPAPAQALDALVALATDSRDPAVYAMALQSCTISARDRSAPGCTQVSAADWAAIDTDNAVPWLQLAREAAAANDPTAQAAAVEQATQAHRVDSYAGSVMAFTQPEIPLEATPLQRDYLISALNGVEGAWWQPQYRAALTYCSGTAIADPLVSRRCEALASLLEKQGSTLLDAGVAADIGARLGWSTQRVDALRLEVQAGHGIYGQDTGAQWSCDNLRTTAGLMTERARLGDRQLARELIESSGFGAGDWRERWHTRMNKLLDNSAAPDDAATANPGHPAPR